MKILLVHRYFSPDTPPYASMLRTIGKRLVNDGHLVEVLSTQPSYKATVSVMKQPSREQVDGMLIRRISLFPEVNKNVLFRLLNVCYFPLRVFAYILLHKKFDMVMASTAPPVVVGFAAALGVKLRGGEFVYHCMDIHPEIGELSGEFKNPVLFKILHAMDSFTCSVARTIVVLSEDMRKSMVKRRNLDYASLSVINNFPMPHFSRAYPVNQSLLKGKNKFRVLFAGNVGRFQGLELFVDAMRRLAHRTELELTIVGDGKALLSLKQCAHDLTNVRFIPHQSESVAAELMSDADLGVVSLSENIYKYAYPSKTMSYLDAGCPLLLSLENESELARFVEENNIGICVGRGSGASIADAIERIYLDKPAYAKMKKSVQSLSGKYFTERAALEQWSELVSKCQVSLSISP